MSNNIPIRPGGQGGTQGTQGTRPGGGVVPNQQTIAQEEAAREAEFERDEFAPAAQLEPAGAATLGKQNPLLNLSVDNALKFLKGVSQSKQLEIAGSKVSVRDLEQVLIKVAQGGGGGAKVGDILEQIGSQAQTAAKVPLQNATVAKAVEGLQNLPPNQVVLNTNSPGGGAQAITASTLLSLLGEVSKALGPKAENMTVAQALQFVAQASAQKPPPTQ